MNTLKLDALPGDRARDAAIAEHVMGWEWVNNGKGIWFLRAPGPAFWYGAARQVRGQSEETYYDDALPRFWTEIAGAWLVVRRMEELGFWCQMRTPFGNVIDGLDDGYWAGFTPHGDSGWNGKPDYWTTSPALPESICRAAWRAMGEDPSV